MPPKTAEGWDARYRSGDLPWDAGIASPELLSVLKELPIRPGRAVELGCGTGSNVLAFAERGWNVTGYDLSPTAIEQATARVESAERNAILEVANLCDFQATPPPFDFLFDRGCYHCVRGNGWDAYRETVRRLTQPGSYALIIAGNPNSGETTSMPKVSASELCDEWEADFQILRLREIHLQDGPDVQGPLAWSLLCLRREA